MILLGLTGSIGMGKSTAAKMLRGLRVPVHASDEAVHKLLAPRGKAVNKIAKIFPSAVKTHRRGKDKGKKYIDRKILGAAAFHDAKLMAALEKILHPMVRQSEKAFLKAAKKAKKKLVVFDIPLLFEVGAETRVHGVIVVTASKKIQQERVLARPHMTKARFRAIVKKQMSDKEKRKRADIIIDTGKGMAATQRDLKRLVTAFV